MQIVIMGLCVLRASVVIFCLIACCIPCRAEDRLLLTEKIVTSEPGAEFAVQIQASAPGTSWQDAGHECAPVKVLLDGRYDQHLFLFGDARETRYDFLVGPLAKGE